MKNKLETKINLKISENLKRKIIEIQIKYDKIKLGETVGETVLPPNKFFRHLKATGTGGAYGNAEVRVLQIRTSTRTIHCAMQCGQLLVSLM